MKKFYLSLTLIAVALIALSCTQMLPDRVERFVDRVEKNASTYTEEDWERASEQFTKLADEYKESYDKLSKEDRTRIDKAIGRYHAVVIKSGINNVINSFNQTVNDLSNKFKGALDAVGSFFKGLGAGAEDPAEQTE